MHIVSAITGESTMAVSPRMAICSGIVLPEAVFNQQPITNIVFHIVRTSTSLRSMFYRSRWKHNRKFTLTFTEWRWQAWHATQFCCQVHSRDCVRTCRNNGSVFSSCPHSSERRMTSRMRFCGMSAAVARFTCKFPRSNSLRRRGMEQEKGRVLITW